MHRWDRIALALVAGMAISGQVARADHARSQPLSPLSPGLPAAGAVKAGEGTWQHVVNLPPNPGSDNTVFRMDPTGPLFGVVGTLGQGDRAHVGQRFVRLTDRPEPGGAETVNVKWVADFGSSVCTASRSATGLQHDNAVVRSGDTPQLLADATDALTRCHDPSGGGLELVDISGLGQEGFLPTEVQLLRLQGYSHTVTADPKRDGILYNSTSDIGENGWLDVIDVRSCWVGADVAAKRANCSPKVYRLPYGKADKFHGHTDHVDTPAGNDPSACHDIVVQDDRLYCAGINETSIIDISRMFDADGNVRGTPLTCTTATSARSGAPITDCSKPGEAPPEAEGWEVLGVIFHAGYGTVTYQPEPPAEDISISHEARPTPDNRWMFVTDERGGGMVPVMASCWPGADNPYGNGGVHVFDISDPTAPQRARMRDGDADPTNNPPAVFMGKALVPASTFCTSHRMELIPGENRFVIAWYSQGVKIVDYAIDEEGYWSFKETAAIVLPGATTWTATPFHIERHEDGQVTYHLLTSDISRGLDVIKWTGPANPTPTPAPSPDAGVPPADGGTPGTDAGTPGTDAGTPGTDAGTPGGTPDGGQSTPPPAEAPRGFCAVGGPFPATLLALAALYVLRRRRE